MKAVEGVSRVDVIYRRIDDTFLDPESLNPDSVLGVPVSCERGGLARSPSRMRRERCRG